MGLADVSTEGTYSSDRSRQAVLCCATAKRLEHIGNYREAREVLAEFWPAGETRPVTDGLDGRARADLLVRAGALTGFLGGSIGGEGMQAAAKDLLSEGIRLLEELGDASGVAEASIDLSRCYRREGALNEARDLLNVTLERVGETDTAITARALVVLGYVERIAARLHSALRIHQRNAPLMEACTDHALLGEFHDEYAAILLLLGESEERPEHIDLALIEYAAASFHFEQAGHLTYRGRVENNQGHILFRLGKFEDAEAHLTTARRIFRRLNAPASIAQVEDSIARALIAQGRLPEAERTARDSVRALERSDKKTVLAESLVTLGVALARSGKKGEAYQTFRRAIGIAEESGSADKAGRAALSILEEIDLEFALRCRIHIKAITLFDGSQDLSIGRRMRAAAKLTFEMALAGMGKPDDRQIELPTDLWNDFSLEDELRTYEERLLQKAMTDANGRIARAAQLLGISHQSLGKKLNTRFPGVRFLQCNRRKRSLIKGGPPAKVLDAATRFRAQAEWEADHVETYEMSDDSLSAVGVRAGDVLVVAVGCPVRNGDPAVVLSQGDTYAGIYRDERSCVVLSPACDDFEDVVLEKKLADVQGKIVGYVKSTDADKEDPTVHDLTK